MGSSASATDREPKTRHKNSIRELGVYKQDGDKLSKFSSCALDGRVLLWDLKDVAKNCEGFAQ